MFEQAQQSITISRQISISGGRPDDDPTGEQVFVREGWPARAKHLSKLIEANFTRRKK
jgi:hypothetical protein